MTIFMDGYDEGHNDGYMQGFEAGWAAAKAEPQHDTSGYNCRYKYPNKVDWSTARIGDPYCPLCPPSTPVTFSGLLNPTKITSVAHPALKETSGPH